MAKAHGYKRCIHRCSCCLADQCLPMPVREATAAEVTVCHGPHHMARVAAKSALAAADAVTGGSGRAHFSPDTYVNQHTLLCARLAAGACADVAAAVVRCALCTLWLSDVIFSTDMTV